MVERTELQVRQAIAYDIVRDLVCCDIFERMEAAGKDEFLRLRKSSDFHPICYYARWSAWIAEHGLSYCPELSSIELVDDWIATRGREKDVVVE